jgi:hypothetical protein
MKLRKRRVTFEDHQFLNQSEIEHEMDREELRATRSMTKRVNKNNIIRTREK